MTTAKPLRALIIEDNPNDAELLRRELKRSDYDLAWAQVQTGDEMRAELRDKTWDIIFSDWHMPQFSATEALEILVESGLDLPFIIISGTVGEEVAVNALHSGAHDFFSKGKLIRLKPAIERELREATLRHERAEMQKQLMITDRLASVGMLAAAVGHEINNPLTAVLGNLELARAALYGIQNRPTGPYLELQEALGELDDAFEAASRIRDVANDLRLFSRFGDDEPTAVDVLSVVESSLRMAQTEILHRCRLETSLEPVPLVCADASKLGQVFLNLLVNAAQAIPEGQPSENRIFVSTTKDDDGHVVVTFTDTGVGMSDEVQRKLFTPFFTTKPTGVGTGLGLSICHRIVDSFGGSITVESKLGEGSTFAVHLPIADRDRETSDIIVTTPSAVPRGTVLIVDDEPTIGMLTQKVLERDHDVTMTTKPREALAEITGGKRYDVIICDLMMAELTGMDLYAAIAEVAPDQANDIVFLTGGAFSPDSRAFLENTSNQCIEKPFDFNSLRAIVNGHVAAH